MASKKFADHTLYHLSPKGFWKKFRDAVVVNPEISSGLPLQGVHRFPPPASRTENYATPATKASDPAQNPYWKRDVRRAYPQLSVVTQSDLSTFLLQSPEQPAVGGPEQTSGEASVPATVPKGLDLSSAISAITSKKKVFSDTNLPPTPSSSFKRWRPEPAPDAPHDPSAYFPMILVK